MGMIQTTLRVKNPRDPSRFLEDEFLVDSGATFTVVPKKALLEIGIMPLREEKFTLADGKVITRQIGNAIFEYQGLEGAAPVLFGEKGDSLLLGVFTLEALGLSLDPLQRRFYKATLRL
jgi:clan AA aspartic protease